MTYEQYRAIYTALNDAVTIANRTLNTLPGVGSGSMGLTPDAVKATPEYRAAKTAFDTAKALHDGFAKPFARIFAKQIRADIDARRAAKLAQNNPSTSN